MFRSSIKYYLSFVKVVNRYLWSVDAVKARPVYIRYGIPLLLIIIVTYLKLNYFDFIGGGTPFLLYFVTVIIATGFGGVGPGILTALITSALVAYFFLPVYYSYYLTSYKLVLILLYNLECLLLISLSGAVTRASYRVRKTAERFHALVENSADGIAVVNNSNKFLYVSPAVEKALGYTHKEFRKIDPWSLIHPEEEETVKSFYAEVMRSPGKPLTLLHRYKHKDGTWAWVESTVNNLLEDPSVKGIVSNFRNVSERVYLERQKDDFIGIATHELKTPVTSIKAYAQILLNRFSKENNTSAFALIEKMDGQLNKLIALIGDLLDVTKIEAGKLQLQEGFYDFNTLITEVVEDLQRTTSKQTINVKLEQVPKIFGDRERVGQVFTNLITNAIKYSPNAEEINVITTANKDEVTICVEDHGVGISKNNQAKVFERFYRVSGPESQSFPGLGLGLYISSEIVKRHCGRIWVESEKDKGSTFCFSLPLDYRLHLQNRNTEDSNGR